MRVLAVGNSFAQDTFTWLPLVAKDLGQTEFQVARLFKGGCSINMHVQNLEQDLPAYTYASWDGRQWVKQKNFKGAAAIADGPWDYIVIQHGTKDGSRYSKPESYENLPVLIGKIKAIAPDAKIVFNMTWVGEANKPKSEMPEYADRLEDLYRDIAALTCDLVQPMAGIDKVCPTGTAIQNLRQLYPGNLCRDGYHLSYDLGRFTAAVAFYHALTGNPVDKLKWQPAGVTASNRRKAIKAAKAAAAEPFCVSLKGAK